MNIKKVALALTIVLGIALVWGTVALANGTIFFQDVDFDADTSAVEPKNLAVWSTDNGNDVVDLNATGYLSATSSSSIPGNEDIVFWIKVRNASAENAQLRAVAYKDYQHQTACNIDFDPSMPQYEWVSCSLEIIHPDWANAGEVRVAKRTTPATNVFVDGLVVAEVGAWYPPAYHKKENLGVSDIYVPPEEVGGNGYWSYMIDRGNWIAVLEKYGWGDIRSSQGLVSFQSTPMDVWVKVRSISFAFPPGSLDREVKVILHHGQYGPIGNCTVTTSSTSWEWKECSITPSSMGVSIDYIQILNSLTGIGSAPVLVDGIVVAPQNEWSPD